MNDDNRRIAKNTIYLYSRMIVMMLVTLYTSRIILEKLGVDDYGIYQAVGGIVGFLSFINGVLSTGLVGEKVHVKVYSEKIGIRRKEKQSST